MKSFSFFLLTWCLSFQVWGYVVKNSTALSKMAENSGSGVYLLEQDVQFTQDSMLSSNSGHETGMHELSLKEQWLVFDDSHMKLTVIGPGIRWSYVYENGNRYQILSSGKKVRPISDQFVEKLFHFRKHELLEKALQSLGIQVLKPDDQPKLSRQGGVVTLAFGAGNDGSTMDVTNEGAPTDRPILFLEQDQFVLRKLRLSTGAEMTAEHYMQYPRGLQFPKNRTIHWTQKLGTQKTEKTVSLQTLHVQAKFEKKPTLNLEPSQGALLDSAMQTLVEEFYSRFR